MAMSHIVYADKYCKKYATPQPKEDFYLGVNFPDIRRVANISRADTHLCFNPLDLDFSGMDAFQSGWKFHVWADLRRNELLRDAEFFEIDIVRKAHYLSYFFLEDELNWRRYHNWETISNLYRDAPYKQIVEGVNKSEWRYWYEILSEYFMQEPDENAVGRVLGKMTGLGHLRVRVIDEIKKLRKNKNVVQILETIQAQMIM